MVYRSTPGNHVFYRVLRAERLYVVIDGEIDPSEDDDVDVSGAEAGTRYQDRKPHWEAS